MRLTALVEEIAWEESKRFVGREVEVLVAEGEGRKDGATMASSGIGSVAHISAELLRAALLRWWAFRSYRPSCAASTVSRSGQSV